MNKDVSNRLTKLESARTRSIEPALQWLCELTRISYDQCEGLITQKEAERRIVALGKQPEPSSPLPLCFELAAILDEV
jgi:hypothetical protein